MYPANNKGKTLWDRNKYPDLLLNMVGGRGAIEVELHTKSRARYRNALRGFRSLGVRWIVFVIQSEVTKSAICRAAVDIQFPSQEILLGFTPQGKWQKDPLNAPIFFSENISSLSSLIRCS